MGQRSRYNGGDLKGLTPAPGLHPRPGRHGSVWITPPVANQWTDPAGNYTGYHGYWAEHFKKVDKHLGSLADYKEFVGRLASARHVPGAGHCGQPHGKFFQRAWGVWRKWTRLLLTSRTTAHNPVARPSQSPFDRNDPRDPEPARPWPSTTGHPTSATTTTSTRS